MISLRGIAGAAQTLAINAVSIYGVFIVDWPVGTAIVLYWSENLLRGLLIVFLLGVSSSPKWRSQSINASVTAGKLTAKSLLAFTLAFGGAHALFLAVILSFVVPRVSPGQRFELGSFRQGLAVIAILLGIELLIRLSNVSRRTEAHFQGLASAYGSRVVVLHLAIVLGMFGIVLLDRVTILFGSFAALKTLVELASQFRASHSSVAVVEPSDGPAG